MIEMSNSEYHGNEALGSSLLAVLLKNAKKAKAIIDGELKIRNKALDFGTAFHTFLLEPEKFDDLVIVDDRIIPQKIKDYYDSGIECSLYPQECLTPGGSLSTSKKSKEILAMLSKEKIYMTPNEMGLYDLYAAYMSGKIILSSLDLDLIYRMRDKLFELRNFEEFLRAGVKERSFFAEIDGVKLKCRPDLLVRTKKGYIVIDLKTMGGEATAEEFTKSSANYLYYLQDFVYRRVLKENGIEVDEFLFAGVSKRDESGAAYFKHDYIALEHGEELFHKALFKYKWCSENDRWEEGKFDFVNGGFSEVNEVSLPAYAFYQFL